MDKNDKPKRGEGLSRMTRQDLEVWLNEMHTWLEKNGKQPAPLPELKKLKKIELLTLTRKMEREKGFGSSSKPKRTQDEARAYRIAWMKETSLIDFMRLACVEVLYSAKPWETVVPARFLKELLEEEKNQVESVETTLIPEDSENDYENW